MMEELFVGMLAELWLACGREQPAETAKAVRELTPAQQEMELNKGSFRYWAGTSGCLVRAAEGFVNHLYVSPDGEVGRAVVALNTKTGAVTVSLADPIPGISCREIVQQLWGPLAGGHDGIAGSPRGEVYGEEQLQQAAEAMAAALLKAFPD